MKKKMCCIFMLIVFLLNSSIMLLISEAVEAIQKMTEEKVKALAEINLTKYENFDTITENSDGGSKGVLVQFNLKTGIEYEENEEYAPIQKTETNIALPWIKNIRPSRVELITKSTQATNSGKDARYEYHQSTGILTIIAENNDYTEKVENAIDEYEIICIYNNECYTENEETLKVQLNTYETLKNNENTVISTSKEETYTVNENIGNIISIEHETENIYDGYIKANKLNNENKYETEYSEKMKIMISNKDIAEQIEVKENSETSLYIETSIDRNQIMDILGDKGSIDIFDDSSNIIKTINKDSQPDENGKIKLVYQNRTQNIMIQLNNIQKEGIVELENKRIIEPTAEIIDNKISTHINIKGINIALNKTEETEEIVKYERQEENQVKIEEAISKVNLKLENNVFANKETNNTKIILTLRTSSSKYSLFKNPTISIEMPKEVEELKIETPEIMYDNNVFSIVSSNITINENGNKVINIQLQGEQTSYYSNTLVNGVNIVIPVAIDLTKELENKIETIKCTHTNEMVSNTENTERKVKLLNKIVNDYSNLASESVKTETTTTNTEKKLILTKDILAGNKKEIFERQVQKITLTLKNNTNEEITNVNIQDEIPSEFVYINRIGDMGNANDYVDDTNTTIFEKKVDKIDKNEVLTFEYYVRVKQDETIQNKTVSSKAKATIEGETEVYESNTIENTIKESKFQIDMVATTDNEGLYEINTLIDYKIVVKNITNETLTGVTITTEIPETTEFEEAFYLKYDEEQKTYLRIYSEEYINNEYNKDTRIVTWNIGTLQQGQEVAVLVAEKLNEINDNSEVRIVKTTAKVKAENTQEYISNIETINEKNKGVYQVKLSTNLTDKYVYEGDNFEYIATVVNTGNYTIKNAIMDIELPTGLTGVEVDYSTESEVEQILYMTQTGSITFSIAPNETFTAKIVVNADELADGVEQLEIKNSVKISGTHINEMISNEITTIILKKKEQTDTPSNPTEPDNPDNPDTPTEPDDPNTPSNPDVSQDGYKISGVVWLDENQNGSREENEKLMSGIEVNLYYESGLIAKDSDNNDLYCITGADGKYEFTNLKKGEYVVAFLYDSDEYTTTEYQSESVNDNANSDAMETSVEINGEEKTVGLTNTIKIVNTDMTNIDLGLIERGIFDLKLEKTISKIIVQNNQKTKTYEFNKNKSKMTKIEIDRKQATNTTIVVEYKINVTNEGEIAGYAQEIIDYYPEELEFKSELNNDWYLFDGNLVSTGLSETLIKPGETASLTLVLTKKLTQNDFKTITNTAEILEDYNEKLEYDIDSTPGNEVDDEDDISSVSIIVAVRTGNVATYTMFIIIIMAILGLGIYIIKKNILGKEVNDESF